jgi:hypothetical protein
MALSWMSALKVIPWSDVIEAAPGLVKGARKIFTRSQQTEVPAASAEPGGGSVDLSDRVSQLEASLAQIAEQQGATARLVESLAEQNARIVEAVDILRVRTRLLMGACAVLAMALVAAVAWGAR